MTANMLECARQLAVFQRAHLANLERAIETRGDDLQTLIRRRQSVVEALASTEEYIKSKTESDRHNDENHER